MPPPAVTVAVAFDPALHTKLVCVVVAVTAWFWSINTLAVAVQVLLASVIVTV